MFSTDSTVLSLESVLEDTNSDLFKEFATYLHQSYCIENLGFWLATQEYYTSCHRKELCCSMIHLYIRPNSPQEINIPCDMRQSILDDFKAENYHLHIFDQAAEAVLELMRVNSFLPWTTLPVVKKSIRLSQSFTGLSTWFKPLGRKSCSSFDSLDFSASANTTTRYRSMLKRVKNSLMGHHDDLVSPTSSSSSSSWRKSLR